MQLNPLVVAKRILMDEWDTFMSGDGIIALLARRHNEARGMYRSHIGWKMPLLAIRKVVPDLRRPGHRLRIIFFQLCCSHG